MAEQKTVETGIRACVHCGYPCRADSVTEGDLAFCCSGCRAVYGLLHDEGLATYYRLAEAPGTRPGDTYPGRFAYLDDPTTVERLIDFDNGIIQRVTFSIPQIHCSSCIWLLEQLPSIKERISEAVVDFPRREVRISYEGSHLSLRQLVEFLTSLGYEPSLTLSSLTRRTPVPPMRMLYARLATAGFCFGNIMLLSFPEYLGIDALVSGGLAGYLNLLNLVLSLPVVFFSAAEFLAPAWNGLRNRMINMDVPIAMGIVILHTRSIYEILVLDRAGYVDSLAALVFLLLVGRLYQKKTYAAISFDRDYLDYFPIAVQVKRPEGITTCPLHQIRAGDRLIIRNAEIVPADSILIRGEAHLDYSFVTGESEPTSAVAGDRVYAGAWHLGPAIEVDVIKESAAGRFVDSWQDQAEGDRDTRLGSLADRFSRYFTLAVLGLALLAALFWLVVEPAKALDAATAVLIVACPCALALATPFTMGTVQRMMGRAGLFLRGTSVVERLAGISSIVFDKTGTVTDTEVRATKYQGMALTNLDRQMIASLARNSTHPLAQAVVDSLDDIGRSSVATFDELPGRGLGGTVDGCRVRLGSARWVGAADPQNDQSAESQGGRVYVRIDDQVKGFFVVERSIRSGLRQSMAELTDRYAISLLSGDNAGSKSDMRALLGDGTDLRFGQLPEEKYQFVREHQQNGDRVLMVGDGLNDAGALRAATVGLSVSDSTTAFSPACDGVLLGDRLVALPQFLRLSRRAMTIIKLCFGLSFAYNLIGLFFAVRAELSPVIAAILMPASSVTVVLTATALSYLAARRLPRRTPWK